MKSKNSPIQAKPPSSRTCHLPPAHIQNSKAQIWSLDIMVGLGLFLVSIVIFYVYSINQPSQARESLDLLSNEGKTIADNLLSTGYPENWEESSVIKIGLTNNNKINQTKLDTLYQMSQNNYARTKNLFNTGNDYYIFFEENMTVNSNSIEGFGKPGATLQNIESKNLVKISRFTVYQNKTTPLYIYIWQE